MFWLNTEQRSDCFQAAIASCKVEQLALVVGVRWPHRVVTASTPTRADSHAEVVAVTKRRQAVALQGGALR
jgi:hypothetical protein